MIVILIKSTLCLFLLLGIYNLFLEKEKMSRFNRFYLLGSVVFSFAIPFLKFDFEMGSFQNKIIPNTHQIVQGEMITISNEIVIWPTLLWLFYGAITTLLLFRFGKNILEISTKIKSNAKEKYKNATLVLVDEKILPHTFLSYIFINKNDFENRNIEEELYTHELTHVRQKHTLDVLFIEFLKTIFWFNPILILYKKAIQLNHEFLADEKVVKSYNNVPFYQNLLLEKAAWNSNFYLASNLNFLVTKKRLIMMTKTTSKSRALLKKIVVLPVLAGLIFISCSENSKTEELEKKVLQEKSNTLEIEEVKPEDVPTQPEFPGGMEAFYKFVGIEYKIPKGFSGKGKIILTFVVNTEGDLEEMKIVEDPGFGTGEEALRIMKKSPKWNPGLKHGKPVRVQYHLPIQLDAK